MIHFLITIFSFVLSSSAARAEACDMVFFDLGQTIVDTDTNKYDPMFYLQPSPERFTDAEKFPSSKHYIDALSARGFKLGLIMDIPEEWGVNYPKEAPIQDVNTAKIVRTMDFTSGIIEEDEVSWTGPEMDWSAFGKISGTGAARVFTGEIYLPHKTSERKSKGSLLLFEKALASAKAKGCRAIFQGENEKEMALAEKAGLIPFWVGKFSVFFLPIDKIAAYADHYQADGWKVAPAFLNPAPTAE